MRVSKTVLEDMRAAFWGRATESGGMLGMCDGVVCRFVFDEGEGDSSEYIPNTDRLNAVLALWRREGIEFCGMVHTHIGGCREPSSADMESMHAIYHAVQKDFLYFPIVTFTEGEMELAVYRIGADGIVKEQFNI